MSTLPGRSGVISLALSFAATFGLVLAVAETASNLLVAPAPRASNPRPVPPPTVLQTIRTGLIVDGTGVSRDGVALGTADEVVADHAAITASLRDHARVGPQDPLAGHYGTTVWVKPDGSPAAALATAAAAIEAGYDSVVVVADQPLRPYLACEITVAPTDAAIAAAKMSGTIEAACAAATAVAQDPDAA